MADRQELNITAGQTPSVTDKIKGFYGTFAYTIDSKNRLIIPQPFRDELGERFAACPSPDYSSVALYPLQEWIKRRDKLIELCEENEEAEEFLEEFSSYSYLDNEMDSQGRVILSPVLRVRYLGDEHEVILKGVTTHVKIQLQKNSDLTGEEFRRKHSAPLTDLKKLRESHSQKEEAGHEPR